MIGIQFEITNEYGSPLEKILCNIHTEKYKWLMPCEEVFDAEGNFFFEEDLYNNLMFRELIKKRYYIVHLMLLGNQINKDFIHIDNYDDYISSSCEILISIIDSTKVRIFCKNETILKTIAENAKKNMYNHIGYIYQKGDYKNFFEESLL